MQEILHICLVSIGGVVLAGFLKNEKQEYAQLLILCLGLYVFSFGIKNFNEVIEKIRGVRQFLGEYETYVTLLFKITGITYLCQLCAGICKDAGYGNIGEQMEIVGKLWILFQGFPILMSVITRIQNLW